MRGEGVVGVGERRQAQEGGKAPRIRYVSLYYKEGQEEDPGVQVTPGPLNVYLSRPEPHHAHRGAGFADLLVGGPPLEAAPLARADPVQGRRPAPLLLPRRRLAGPVRLGARPAAQLLLNRYRASPP